MTTYEVKGRGPQTGIVQTVNGYTLYADLLPKTKIELVVKEENLTGAMGIIAERAHSGADGAARVFVSTVDEIVRIRTGETGEEAV